MATADLSKAVTGKLSDGSSATFKDAATAKQYGATLDSSPNKTQISRSQSVSDEVNSRAPAPTNPDAKPGDLVLDGQIYRGGTPISQQPAAPMTPANMQNGLDVAKTMGTAPQEAGAARTAVQTAVNTAAQTPSFYKPDANNPQIVSSTGEKLDYNQYLAQGGKADFSNVKAGNPPQANQTSPLTPIESQLSVDPGYQQLLADRQEFMSEVNQQGTLLKQYQQMIKQAGISAIDKELLNTRKIIDGTEDDIRKEVQAASGFATDSQVLALASARNKTLIQNYNNLLATKEMAMQQVNTMVNLAAQDRNFAMQAITQKMNFDQQILEYRDKFINNAKEGYNNYIKAVGYGGLYSSVANDPQSLAVVEKTLGLPSGGLAQAAQIEAQAQAKAQAQQDFENRIAQQQVNISGGNLALSRERFELEKEQAALKGPDISQAQYTAAGYAERVQQSNKTITELQDQFAKKSALGGTTVFGFGLPNYLKTSDRQVFEQAERNFINAVLRRESGAAISPDEFKSAEIQYFPQPGDSAAVLSQKSLNRQIVENNLINTAGPALDPKSNDPLGLFQ